jgi:hypothetical protein
MRQVVNEQARGKNLPSTTLCEASAWVVKSPIKNRRHGEEKLETRCEGKNLCSNVSYNAIA